MEVPVKKTTERGRVEAASDRPTFAPCVDVLETAKDVILVADMPGVSKDGLSVTLDQGLLTIRGKVNLGLPDNAELDYCELDFGDYERTFRLGPEVSSSNLDASFEDGVLRLVFPKSDWASTKKIEVK